MSRRNNLSLLCLALAAWLAQASPAGAAAPKPHLIVILQDDLGHNDVAFNGGPHSAAASVTGNITALANAGVIFDRHYVHWHCSPTRRSFISGRLPIHHGEQLSRVSTDDLDIRWTWISEKLKSAGYVGHWYGKGHTGYASTRQLPINRGFEGGHLGFLTGAQSYTSSDRWEGEFPLHNNTDYATTLYGEVAVRAIEAHDPSVPLFMYLPNQAMHTPYDKVPGWDIDTPCFGYDKGGSTYCGMLWDADVYVGRIVSALKAKNMYDNTLIWYSGDNGGVGTGINYPLRGEKHSNWEGGFRVAAFVSGGFLPAALRGTHNDIVFHIVDWYPTFCALAGVEGTDDPPVAPLPVDPANVNKDIYGNESFPPLDGTNIWPMVTEPTAFNQTSAHASLAVSKEVLVVGRYKLLVSQPKFKSQNNGWKQLNGSWTASDDSQWPCNTQDGPLDQILPGVPGQLPCLFDLNTDNGEHVNIAADNKPLVQAMWAQLNRTVLTTYLHGASGPAGNPGGVVRCSPTKLLGACNLQCAKAYYAGKSGVADPREPRISDGNDDLFGPQCGMTLLKGTCLRGGSSKSVGTLHTATATGCCAACQQNRECTEWTYNLEEGKKPCRLKSGSGNVLADPNCTSGTSGPSPPPSDCPDIPSADFPVCGVPGCE